MQRRPAQGKTPGAPRANAGADVLLAQWLRRPQILFPVAIVGGMLLLAFGLQPGGTEKPDKATAADLSVSGSPTLATPSPAATTAIKTPATAATPRPSTTAADAGGHTIAPPQDATPLSQVAGVQATPAPDTTRQNTQCGALQEVTTDLSVEQVLNGVSMRATRATVYPIEYFRCILMATGGADAVALSASVAKAQREDFTHAVLIDLWITNSAKDFGQLSMKTATLAAAGRVFAPLATLGGRAEVVISGGQGRTVTLVVPVKSTVGDTIGPVTLIADAPLVGGKTTLGKYQLFLPTP